MRARARIGALCAACAVFAVLLLACNALFPAQAAQVDPAKDYGYVYSGAKSASVAFASQAMTDDCVLLFGSSELSTPPSLVPTVPANIFGVRDCGVSLMCIGEAYDQSLWHAIAAGAYAPQVGSGPLGAVHIPWETHDQLVNPVLGNDLRQFLDDHLGLSAVNDGGKTRQKSHRVGDGHPRTGITVVNRQDTHKKFLISVVFLYYK